MFYDKLPIVGNLARIPSFLAGHSPWGAAVAGLLLGLFLTPGMMFVLAIVAEGRFLHYKDQFRAFMPGDILLGISFALFCQTASIYKDEHAYGSKWVQLLAIIAGLAVVVAKGTLDIVSCILGVNNNDHYTRKQLLSVTKVYHNTVAYFVYVFLFVSVGVPSLVCAIYRPKLLPTVVLAAAFIVLLCWFVLLIRDCIAPTCNTAHVEVKSHHWLVGLPLILLAFASLTYLIS